MELVHEVNDKNSSHQKADDKRVVKNLARNWFFCILVWYILDIFTFMTSPERNNLIEVAKHFAWFCSTFASDYVNILIVFTYVCCCVEISSMFKQVQNDLEVFQSVKDMRVNKELKKFIENYEKMLKLGMEVINEFKTLITLCMFLDVCYMSQTLVYMSTLLADQNYYLFTNVITLILPFMLIDAWLYCFGSQKIITQVKLYLGLEIDNLENWR